eukprot:scaffold1875_cov253-Pinguiococcus_pyrenoidosus.AAC.18
MLAHREAVERHGQHQERLREERTGPGQATRGEGRSVHVANGGTQRHRRVVQAQPRPLTLSSVILDERRGDHLKRRLADAAEHPRQEQKHVGVGVAGEARQHRRGAPAQQAKAHQPELGALVDEVAHQERGQRVAHDVRRLQSGQSGVCLLRAIELFAALNEGLELHHSPRRRSSSATPAGPAAQTATSSTWTPWSSFRIPRFPPPNHSRLAPDSAESKFQGSGRRRAGKEGGPKGSAALPGAVAFNSEVADRLGAADGLPLVTDGAIAIENAQQTAAAADRVEHAAGRRRQKWTETLPPRQRHLGPFVGFAPLGLLWYSR